MQAPTEPRAFVVTPETIYSSTGRTWPTPAGLMTDLPYLLNQAAAWFPLGGVLVLIGVKIADLRTDGISANWAHSPITAWTTFRPKQRKSRLEPVHVCIADELPVAHDNPWNRGEDPATIAARLGRIHDLIGIPYRMTPGVTGGELLRSIHTDTRKGRQPRWVAEREWPVRGAGPVEWKRRPTEDEFAAGMLAVRYDVRKAYATAAGVAPVAWFGLQHTPDQAYVRGMAGYWLIRPPMLHKAEGPQPIAPRRALMRGGVRLGVWVTTPTMELYDDLGVHPEVVDAYTALPWVDGVYEGSPIEPSKRVMRTWSRRLADARALVDEDAEPDRMLLVTMKRLGNDTIGMMNRKGGRLYRSDWHDTTLDQSAANLLRKVYGRHAVDGVWPLRVSSVDTAWYAQPAVECPIMAPWVGDGNGALRVVEYMPLAEYAQRTRTAAISA